MKLVHQVVHWEIPLSSTNVKIMRRIIVIIIYHNHRHSCLDGIRFLRRVSQKTAGNFLFNSYNFCMRKTQICLTRTGLKSQSTSLWNTNLPDFSHKKKTKNKNKSCLNRIFAVSPCKSKLQKLAQKYNSRTERKKKQHNAG